MPACAEPEQSAPPDLARQPRAAARNAWLGPSANGGRVVPHHRPSTSSVSSPAAARARQRGVAGERERVLVGRADRDLAPAPLRPQAARDVGGGQAPGGRGRADGDDLNRVAHGDRAYRRW